MGMPQRWVRPRGVVLGVRVGAVGWAFVGWAFVGWACVVASPHVIGVEVRLA